MLDSSVWSYKSGVRIVWVTILLMKDLDGFVKATPDAIRRRSNEAQSVVDEALQKFLSPEPGQEDQPFGGRRLEKVPGGYRVLNHEKYMEMDSSDQKRKRDRERKAKKRAESRLSADSPRVSEKFQGASAEFQHKIRSDEMRQDEIQTRGDEDETIRNKPAPQKRERSKSQLALLPKDWQPSLGHARIADEHGVNMLKEADKMRDWAESNAAKKASWDATFRGWLKRATPEKKPQESKSTFETLFPDMARDMRGAL